MEAPHNLTGGDRGATRIRPVRRAVLSSEHPLDADELLPHPPQPGVMRGAEGPDTPDSERPLVRVADDHALACWARLRDRDQLDSQGATAILREALLKFAAVAVAHKDAPQPPPPPRRRLGRPRKYARPAK